MTVFDLSSRIAVAYGAAVITVATSTALVGACVVGIVGTHTPGRYRSDATPSRA